MAKHSYKTPYKDLLPPLSSEEFEALKQSIKADGVRDPVLLDELGNVLDGHNRLQIDPDAPTRVIKGSKDWTEAQRKAFVYKVNFERRQLSPEQKSEANEARKAIARELSAEGAKQKEIAVKLGASQQTISNWLKEDISDTNGGKSNNSGPRDQRVVVPKEEYETIAERVEAGESQAQVAADYGISQGRVSQVVQAVEHEREREEADEDDRREQSNRIKISAPADVLKTVDRYRLIIVGTEWVRETGKDWLETMGTDRPLEECADEDCLLFLLTGGDANVGYHCGTLIDQWGFKRARRYFALTGTEKYNGEMWEPVIVGSRGKVPWENVVPRAPLKCAKAGIEATLIESARAWLKEHHAEKLVLNFASKIIVEGAVNWSLKGEPVAA